MLGRNGLPVVLTTLKFFDRVAPLWGDLRFNKFRGRVIHGTFSQKGDIPLGWRRSLKIWLDAIIYFVRTLSLTERGSSLTIFKREFDPGSESTLAARLTHASRTRKWSNP